jgi:hypothetical protein
LKFKIDREVSFELEGMARFLGSDRVSGPCTPKIEEGLGLAINAPREVVFSRGPQLDPNEARFIVCGASQFVYDSMGFGARFADQVVFVAVDARTHEARSAAIEPNVPNAVPPPDDLPRSETDHSGTTIGEVFRANLASIMQLPAVESEYIVYIVLGPYRSNSLSVKVVRRRGEP